MTDIGNDVTVDVDEAHVATVEIHRPPLNHFDLDLIRTLADAFESLGEGGARAIVLCSEGKHFCAGADFAGTATSRAFGLGEGASLYEEAVRIFAAPLPIVAAVQGAAIGGGLGLACAADFRVATPATRFAANFARLGIHQGFGLSVTLPRIVGQQAAADLLFTGRRVPGTEALGMGLCDRLVEPDDLRAESLALATEIAGSAPLAVASIRTTLRGDLAEQVRRATQREDVEQERLRRTADFAEGVAATAERRPPRFEGQ